MTRPKFSLTKLLVCVAIYGALFALLARYRWLGILAASIIATPLCGLLLIARRTDRRVIGKTLATSVGGALFVGFFAPIGMTAAEMTFGMSFGAVMGWWIGRGIHLMFPSDDEPPIGGETVNLFSHGNPGL